MAAPCLTRQLVALLGPAWLALAFGLGACGGAAEPAGVCPSPCPCAAGACPETVCGLAITIGADCEPYFPAAEVLVGACHDPGLAEPGRVFRPCGVVAGGHTADVAVRAPGWQWGPVRLSCETGGVLLPLRLHCADALPAIEDVAAAPDAGGTDANARAE